MDKLTLPAPEGQRLDLEGHGTDSGAGKLPQALSYALRGLCRQTSLGSDPGFPTHQIGQVTFLLEPQFPHRQNGETGQTYLRESL